MKDIKGQEVEKCSKGKSAKKSESKFKPKSASKFKSKAKPKSCQNVKVIEEKEKTPDKKVRFNEEGHSAEKGKRLMTLANKKTFQEE